MAKKPLPRFIEPMMASVVIALVSEHVVKRTDAHVSRQPELYLDDAFGVEELRGAKIPATKRLQTFGTVTKKRYYDFRVLRTLTGRVFS